LPFPPVPEQREIARMLSAADRKIEAEEQRKAALQALFEAMLHQLMTGRLRLKGADIETLKSESSASYPCKWCRLPRVGQLHVAPYGLYRGT